MDTTAGPKPRVAKAHKSADDLATKQAAQQLYMTGEFTQLQIAAMLKVSEKTLSRWKTDGEWDRRRTEVSIANTTSYENVWKIVKHTSDVLAAKAEALAADDKVITPADQDGLAKLFKLVQRDALSLEHYIKFARQLMAFIELQNLELAKQVLPLVDQFIAQKQRDLN